MPKAAGIVPINMATKPTVNAYGICVRTCSMWLQPLEMELRMVVSLMGET